MAADLRAVGGHGQVVERPRAVHRRTRSRPVRPARIIVLPTGRRSHAVGDGLLAGSAGAVTLALWASVGATDVMPVVAWFDMMCLVAVGLTAAWLTALAERRPALGFGVVILFVVVIALQLFLTMPFAEPGSVADARAVVGNAVATAIVALVLWRRRGWLVIRP